MNRYLVLAASVLAVVALYSFFESDPFGDYDIIGIAHDVKRTSSGFVFEIDSIDGESTRCFSRTEVDELGLYGISGDMSDDGGIFFVSSIRSIDSQVISRERVIPRRCS